jgi:glycosyltransferase involved in cell wall biosynthesis
MKDRNEIVHVLDGPWYGPAENAFNTINKDLPQFSHVFADVSPLRPGFEPTEEWARATAAVQQRADQHVVPENGSVYDGAFRVVVYGCRVPEAVQPPPGISATWTFSGGPADMTSVPWMEGSGAPVYPMVDYDRLIGLAGKVTRTTVGVFWDPHSEEPMADVANAARSRMSEGRLVTMPCAMEPVDGLEILQREWEIGFDWMYCSLCDAVVCRAGERAYPYLLVCSMAMGKPCVALSSGGPVPDFVRHAVTCLVAKDADEAADMARWILSNPEKARRLGAAAQFAVASQDKDPNMLEFRKAVLG